jgi:hypothetical protein
LSALALTGFALSLCACGAGAQPAQRARAGTPLHAVLGWFAAINAKDAQSAKSYFAASARYMMDWGPASEWSTFAKVHCTTRSATRTHALLGCTFDESSSPTEGSADTWWSVDLQRVGQNWLIDNYGQP